MHHTPSPQGRGAQEFGFLPRMVLTLSSKRGQADCWRRDWNTIEQAWLQLCTIHPRVPLQTVLYKLQKSCRHKSFCLFNCASTNSPFPKIFPLEMSWYTKCRVQLLETAVSIPFSCKISSGEQNLTFT